MKPRPIRAERFTRQQRLTRPSEFSRVMAKAVRSSDELFTVLARANSENCARLGLAVSRKAARRAVDRNRIKRLSREAFRQCPNAGSFDIIVFARQRAATQSRTGLRNSLDRHLRALVSGQAA